LLTPKMFFGPCCDTEYGMEITMSITPRRSLVPSSSWFPMATDQGMRRSAMGCEHSFIICRGCSDDARKSPVSTTSWGFSTSSTCPIRAMVLSSSLLPSRRCRSVNCTILNCPRASNCNAASPSDVDSALPSATPNRTGTNSELTILTDQIMKTFLSA